MTPPPVHLLKKDGFPIYVGSLEGCYLYLQRCQAQSADYALRFGGYEIKEDTELTLEERQKIFDNDPWARIEVRMIDNHPFDASKKSLPVYKVGDPEKKWYRAYVYGMTWPDKEGIMRVYRNYLQEWNQNV